METRGTIRFKLDELMTEAGWSAYRLAKESGIQETIVAKYRNNAVQAPPLDTLAKFCAALGCGIGDLMEYVPDSPPSKRATKTGPTRKATPRSKKR